MKFQRLRESRKDTKGFSLWRVWCLEVAEDAQRPKHDHATNPTPKQQALLDLVLV